MRRRQYGRSHRCAPFLRHVLAQNLSVALVLKSLGATVSYVALTAALPLADFLFAWPLLMGSSASSFSGWSVGALVVVLAGLVLYRSANEVYTKPPAHARSGSVAAVPLPGAQTDGLGFVDYPGERRASGSVNSALLGAAGDWERYAT